MPPPPMISVFPVASCAKTIRLMDIDPTCFHGAGLRSRTGNSAYRDASCLRGDLRPSAEHITSPWADQLNCKKATNLRQIRPANKYLTQCNARAILPFKVTFNLLLLLPRGSHGAN